MNQGAILYSRDGWKYEFAETLPGDRALVFPLQEWAGWDGETEQGPSDRPMVMRLADLSPKPPVALVDADLAAKREELTELRKQITAERADLADAKKADAERLAAVSRYEGLQRLTDFLAGNITHVVAESYGGDWTIQTFDEAFLPDDEYSRREKGLKLLSLFGDAKGNLSWGINQYRDGSGSWKRSIPCCSEEEARTVALQMLTDAWDEYRANPERAHWLLNASKAADRLGLPIPDDMVAARHALLVKGAKSNLEKAEATAAEARAKLAEVEAA